jgi:hypothetical protein
MSAREPTIEEQLAGQEPMTNFEKTCDKLGIAIIQANSPQAKGRVERNHGVYQDRFVKELKLLGITSIEGANTLLRETFCEQLNTKFAKAPRETADYHRRVPKGMKLEDVFVHEDRRRVSNDWTISHNKQIYQIHSRNHRLPKPKDAVLVRTRLDGTVGLWYDEHALAYSALTPQSLPATPPVISPKASPKKPALNRKRPWRSNCERALAKTQHKERLLNDNSE